MENLYYENPINYQKKTNRLPKEYKDISFQNVEK